MSGARCQVSELVNSLEVLMSEKFITFEKLDVFKRAYKISLEIHTLTKNFPDDERFSLTSQIRQASPYVPILLKVQRSSFIQKLNSRGFY